MSGALRTSNLEAGSGRQATPRRARLLPPPSSSLAPRVAFTLVELLISIAIISILATLLLGVGAVAAEVARESRTKALVTRLHTLVMERYDAYRNRRVELAPYTVDLDHLVRLQRGGGIASSAIPTDANDPRFAALTRLAGLRELMKLEMPDRWADVAGWNGATGVPLPPGVIPVPASTPDVVSLDLATRRMWFLESLPALAKVYLREYQRLASAGVSAEDLRQNQGAELLYLVVMNGTADGEARGLFSENDIDDTDGDGALEFVDGWGNPISFIRWAPGFDSAAQQSVASLIRVEREDGFNGVTDALLDDHDPYDLFRLDNADLSQFNTSEQYVGARSWRLMPLIVSAGGDEEFGLRFDDDRASLVNPYMDYDRTVSNGTQSLGEQTDGEAYADNIHNHAVGSLSQK